MSKRFAGASVVAALVAAALVSFSASGRALGGAQAAEADISGVVTSANGPEEGVWVIAETTSLPTKFVKSVVTGDDGRYLIPDLPEATYDVWVRGYGLVDSDPVTAAPGDTVDLEATVAATPAEAARVYPANYWYSLIRPPATDEFPGTGEDGNGIAANLQHQEQWVDIQKQGCMLCHQLGNRIVREIDNLDQFDSSLEAWDHRVRMGQRGGQMTNAMNRFGRVRGLQMFADWSDRIATGEVPPAPPRPQGIERNVVISMWEWGTDIDYIHDEIATDKRDPTINAGGPVYGVNISNDALTILDPVTHTATSLNVPLRVDPDTVPGMIARSMPAPSRFFGDDLIWNDPANPHNPMMDSKGRVWMTSAIRDRANPDYCQEGSDNPYAKYFPLPSGFRSAVYYEPDREQFVLVDTCFGTHHLQFAEDENDTLYFSGGGQVIGWIDTKLYDETGDERLSQGWCPTVLDTNGDGVITKPWNEPAPRGRAAEQDPDLSLDTRVNIGSYGVIGDPTDDKAVWISSNRFPGRLARLHVGDSPPESCVTEMYEVPSVLDPNVPPEKRGFGSRGLDIDRDGVIWTALSGSSHLASFDRRKCAVHNGPVTAEGRHCVEGWTLYPTPGPTIAGTDPPVRADYHYYNWVDQWDTLGLGRDIPIATGSNSDSLLAFDPDTEEWTVLRVPYPQGFFTRGLDGRIDDPDAGWKGRGVWATYGAAATWHIEGGVGVKPGMLKFQVRPHPLAE
ncbi:MAG: carboxypeptidase regulatory-like domain-containing protein [Acidobacteria bacterium]|nr:carboxypeptidase regulatory-like domain-containing protein [Acidobacteriota bacterium]MYJ05875.1 carboxypeptidase regulatory-like domain-containing protein [Acidobacteriota bacterium]